MTAIAPQPQDPDDHQIVPTPQNMLQPERFSSQPLATDAKAIDTRSRELLNQPMTRIERFLNRPIAKIQRQHQIELIRVQGDSQIEDLKNLRKTATICLRDQLTGMLTLAKMKLAAHVYTNFESEFTKLQTHTLEAQDAHFTWFESAFLELPKFTVPQVRERRVRSLESGISAHQAVMEKALKMAGECLENHLAINNQ